MKRNHTTITERTMTDLFAGRFPAQKPWMEQAVCQALLELPYCNENDSSKTTITKADEWRSSSSVSTSPKLVYTVAVSQNGREWLLSDATASMVAIAVTTTTTTTNNDLMDTAEEDATNVAASVQYPHHPQPPPPQRRPITAGSVLRLHSWRVEVRFPGETDAFATTPPQSARLCVDDRRVDVLGEIMASPMATMTTTTLPVLETLDVRRALLAREQHQQRQHLHSSLGSIDDDSNRRALHQSASSSMTRDDTNDQLPLGDVEALFRQLASCIGGDEHRHGLLRLSRIQRLARTATQQQRNEDDSAAPMDNAECTTTTTTTTTASFTATGISTTAGILEVRGNKGGSGIVATKDTAAETEEFLTGHDCHSMMSSDCSINDDDDDEETDDLGIDNMLIEDSTTILRHPGNDDKNDRALVGDSATGVVRQSRTRIPVRDPVTSVSIYAKPNMDETVGQLAAPVVDSLQTNGSPALTHSFEARREPVDTALASATNALTTAPTTSVEALADVSSRCSPIQGNTMMDPAASCAAAPLQSNRVAATEKSRPDEPAMKPLVESQLDAIPDYHDNSIDASLEEPLDDGLETQQDERFLLDATTTVSTRIDANVSSDMTTMDAAIACSTTLLAFSHHQGTTRSTMELRPSQPLEPMPSGKRPNELGNIDVHGRTTSTEDELDTQPDDFPTTGTSNSGTNPPPSGAVLHGHSAPSTESNRRSRQTLRKAPKLSGDFIRLWV